MDKRGEAANVLWRMRGTINRTLNQGRFAGVVTGAGSDGKRLGAAAGGGG